MLVAARSRASSRADSGVSGVGVLLAVDALLGPVKALAAATALGALAVGAREDDPAASAAPAAPGSG